MRLRLAVMMTAMVVMVLFLCGCARVAYDVIYFDKDGNKVRVDRARYWNCMRKLTVETPSGLQLSAGVDPATAEIASKAAEIAVNSFLSGAKAAAGGAAKGAIAK